MISRHPISLFYLLVSSRDGDDSFTPLATATVTHFFHLVFLVSYSTLRVYSDEFMSDFSDLLLLLLLLHVAVRVSESGLFLTTCVSQLNQSIPWPWTLLHPLHPT